MSLVEFPDLTKLDHAIGVNFGAALIFTQREGSWGPPLRENGSHKGIHLVNY